jgi:hypothetical protein
MIYPSDTGLERIYVSSILVLQGYNLPAKCSQSYQSIAKMVLVARRKSPQNELYQSCTQNGKEYWILKSYYEADDYWQFYATDVI